jgi:hypothetical protein
MDCLRKLRNVRNNQLSRRIGSENRLLGEAPHCMTYVLWRHASSGSGANYDRPDQTRNKQQRAKRLTADS